MLKRTPRRRVLVIGGTRFMGPHLVRLLCDQEHEVAVFHRGQSSATLPPGVLRIQGDRNRLADYAADMLAFRPEVVVDMICVNAAQEHALLDVFAGAAKRVVLASSCDVYKAYGVAIGTEPESYGLEPVPLTESSPVRSKLYPYRLEQPRAANDPAKVYDDYDKIPCEQAVLNHPALAGTVLRLPMVFGPRDYQHRLHEYLAQMDSGVAEIKLNPALHAWRDCRGYVTDMAHALALCAVNDKAAGRVYHVGEPANYSEGEWVECLGQAAGWHGRVVADDTAPPPDGLNAQQHLSIDSSAIRAELGYTEQTAIEEALAATVVWERANPPAPRPS
jgi:nucleoside-diphosphate-sugar epimerase